MNRHSLEAQLISRVSKRRDTALIPRRNSSRAAQLSFAQQGMWLTDRIEPRKSEYLIPFAFRIRGPLNVEALNSALHGVMQRHDTLRTRFKVVDDGPVQTIDPYPQPRFSFVDFSSEIDPHEREKLALANVQKEAVIGFDLAVNQPLSLSISRLSDREHLLLVVIHHIAFDGWSIEIFTRELRELYEEALSGRPNALNELRIQYADYAAWQHGNLTKEVLDRQLNYWSRQLAELEPLELFSDRPRTRERSGAGDTVGFTVSPALTSRLAEIATGHKSSKFMASLAAFQILLSRWSGREDIAVGSPVSGRTHPESEELIGYFVNTLVLRTDVSGDLTFSQLLNSVRATALEAYAHQDLPFERLVEELSPERDLSRTPLFQVSFAYQNGLDASWELPGTTVEPVTLPVTTSKFDIVFALSEQSDGGLTGEITYSTQLFDEATASRMGAHFVRVLEQVVRNPELAISKVELLSEDERAAVLAGQHTIDASSARSTIHELVEAQVVRSPGASAIIFRDLSITYAELDDRAARLATRLREHGVTAGARVGVCAERSLELVVGLLGVLKAGAIFVALNPSDPTERLQFMIEETQISVLLAQQPVRDYFTSEDCVVLDIDTNTEVLARETTRVATQPDDTACILYTSGSTGTPKGVSITHRGLVSRLLWAKKTYKLSTSDRITHMASFGFDLAIWEIFLPLVSGAQLVIAEPGSHRDPRYLQLLVAEQNVTIAHFVPSMLREFLNNADLQELPSLRHVICGGETLTTELAERFFKAHSACALHNIYGPTECSVFVTHWECHDADADTVVPIGRAVENVELLVMDKYRQPVPTGLPGELWIGGVGVALEYLNQPRLTDDRFVQHPFALEPSAKMYRSGDLVRSRADGAIEYLGRIDRQVKLRGQRIELSEVESVLCRHATVDVSTVTVHEDELGNKILVGYCVPAPGKLLDPASLRRWCLSHLPGYMAPSWIITIDGLPLTKSGKVDHRSLPHPSANRLEFAQEYSAPRTDAERFIAEIWANLLGKDRVGIHDNFFDLGGHSLLAVQFVRRLAEKHGIDLPLRVLFAKQSIAELSTHITQGSEFVDSWGKNHHFAPILTLRENGERTPLFCIHTAIGMSWSFTSLMPHLKDRPLYAVQSPALTDIDRLPISIKDAAASYLDRVKSIQPHGPYLFLGRSFGGLVAYEMAVLLEQAGERVDLVGLLDSLPVEADFVPSPDLTDAFEQEALRILLREGLPSQPAPSPAERLDLTTVIDKVRMGDGLMHEWSTDLINRLYEMCIEYMGQTVRYQPSEYHGQILFFAATADDNRPSTAAKTEAWSRFGPDVVVAELDCRHSQVLSPGPSTAISAVLNRLFIEKDV